MAKTKGEQYVNLIAVQTVQTVINTYVRTELQIGLNMFDKYGFLIQRLEYDIGVNVLEQLTTVADNVVVGLVSASSVAATNFTMVNPDVLDIVILCPVVDAAPASRSIQRMPVVHDFSTLKGGGLLVPPRPLYAALYTTGFAHTVGIFTRVYFTLVPLSDSDYLELLETRRGFTY